MLFILIYFVWTLVCCMLSILLYVVCTIVYCLYFHMLSLLLYVVYTSVCCLYSYVAYTHLYCLYFSEFSILSYIIYNLVCCLNLCILYVVCTLVCIFYQSNTLQENLMSLKPAISCICTASLKKIVTLKGSILHQLLQSANLAERELLLGWAASASRAVMKTRWWEDLASHWGYQVTTITRLVSCTITWDVFEVLYSQCWWRLTPNKSAALYSLYMFSEV